MAWASKKQSEILMKSEEGKDLIEKLPTLSQDDFQVEFGKILGKSEISYNRDEDEDYVEDKYDDYFLSEEDVRSPELVKEMEEDAKDEQEAIDEYDETLENVEDENTKKQIEKIQEEEVAHKEYLENAKDNPDAEYKDPDEEENDNEEEILKAIKAKENSVLSKYSDDEIRSILKELKELKK